MSNRQVVLNLQKRTLTGKKAVKLRAQGKVPGVIYGATTNPVNVEAEAIELDKVYAKAGKHHPIQAKMDGNEVTVLVKTADRDPVRHLLRHVSFHAVKQDEIVVAEIPIQLVGEGESLAEKAGLIVLANLESLNVKAKPGDLPNALKVDIRNLAKHGDHLTGNDIKLPKGVEFEHPAEAGGQMLVSVYEPSSLQSAEAEQAQAELAAEPVAGAD